MRLGLRRRLLRFFPSRRGQRLDAAAVRWVGHSPFSWLLARDHGLPYRRPLALTTTGRRSGRPHTIAISHGTTSDGAWTIVASNGGADREPHWLLNLRADPRATVHVARRRHDVRAEILHGDAKQELWEEITARAPVYARYQAGTTRDIPVVVLRPVPGAPAHDSSKRPYPPAAGRR